MAGQEMVKAVDDIPIVVFALCARGGIFTDIRFRAVFRVAITIF